MIATKEEYRLNWKKRKSVNVICLATTFKKVIEIWINHIFCFVFFRQQVKHTLNSK